MAKERYCLRCLENKQKLTAVKKVDGKYKCAICSGPLEKTDVGYIEGKENLFAFISDEILRVTENISFCNDMISSYTKSRERSIKEALKYREMLEELDYA